jgi:hypothetical protein
VVVVALVAAGAYFYRDTGGDDQSATPPTSSATPTQASEPQTSSPTPPPPAATPTAAAPASIEPSALSTYLASVPEVSQIADNAAMTPRPIENKPFSGITVDPFTCSGALTPGIDVVYNGSGFTGFVGQNLFDAPQDHKVIQSIASFASPADAQAFFDKQIASWEQCRFTDVTSTIGNDSATAKTGVTANTDGTASILIFPAGGGPGRQCQHAMTPRANVVVDVRVCAPSVGSAGWTLARDIGEKITGQR